MTFTEFLVGPVVAVATVASVVLGCLCIFSLIMGANQTKKLREENVKLKAKLSEQAATASVETASDEASAQVEPAKTSSNDGA